MFMSSGTYSGVLLDPLVEEIEQLVLGETTVVVHIDHRELFAQELLVRFLAVLRLGGSESQEVQVHVFEWLVVVGFKLKFNSDLHKEI